MKNWNIRVLKIFSQVYISISIPPRFLSFDWKMQKIELQKSSKGSCPAYSDKDRRQPLREFTKQNLNHFSMFAIVRLHRICAANHLSIEASRSTEQCRTAVAWMVELSTSALEYTHPLLVINTGTGNFRCLSISKIFLEISSEMVTGLMLSAVIWESGEVSLQMLSLYSQNIYGQIW